MDTTITFLKYKQTWPLKKVLPCECHFKKYFLHFRICSLHSNINCPSCHAQAPTGISHLCSCVVSHPVKLLCRHDLLLSPLLSLGSSLWELPCSHRWSECMWTGEAAQPATLRCSSTKTTVKVTQLGLFHMGLTSDSWSMVDHVVSSRWPMVGRRLGGDMPPLTFMFEEGFPTEIHIYLTETTSQYKAQPRSPP